MEDFKRGEVVQLILSILKVKSSKALRKYNHLLKWSRIPRMHRSRSAGWLHNLKYHLNLQELPHLLAVAINLSLYKNRFRIFQAFKLWDEIIGPILIWIRPQLYLVPSISFSNCSRIKWATKTILHVLHHFMELKKEHIIEEKQRTKAAQIMKIKCHHFKSISPTGSILPPIGKINNLLALVSTHNRTWLISCWMNHMGMKSRIRV